MERYDGSATMIAVRKVYLDRQGRFQRIQMFETQDFGRMLVLDGKIQCTQRDESHYHEMLVHVPMLSHPCPGRVLLIGGGDGGALREILKHSPEKVTLVEIDPEVMEVCKRYLRIDDGALNDRRVEILFKDGVEYTKGCKQRFDVIIVDSTDPDGISQGLISVDFYTSCKRILLDRGIFATQSQSPFIQLQHLKQIWTNLSRTFSYQKLYLSFIPSYPRGIWSFILASERNLPATLNPLKQRYQSRGLRTRYYNPEIHISSFALPNWLKESLGKSGV